MTTAIINGPFRGQMNSLVKILISQKGGVNSVDSVTYEGILIPIVSQDLNSVTIAIPNMLTKGLGFDIAHDVVITIDAVEYTTQVTIAPPDNSVASGTIAGYTTGTFFDGSGAADGDLYYLINPNGLENIAVTDAGVVTTDDDQGTAYLYVLDVSGDAGPDGTWLAPITAAFINDSPDATAAPFDTGGLEALSALIESEFPELDTTVGNISIIDTVWKPSPANAGRTLIDIFFDDINESRVFEYTKIPLRSLLGPVIPVVINGTAITAKGIVDAINAQTNFTLDETDVPYWTTEVAPADTALFYHLPATLDGFRVSGYTVVEVIPDTISDDLRYTDDFQIRLLGVAGPVTVYRTIP